MSEIPSNGSGESGITSLMLKGNASSADRDAGFCSGEDDDLEIDDIHSPTDASEDSVEVKVTPITSRNKNKRKSAEPRKVPNDETPAGPLKKRIRFEMKQDETLTLRPDLSESSTRLTRENILNNHQTSLNNSSRYSNTQSPLNDSSRFNGPQSPLNGSQSPLSGRQSPFRPWSVPTRAINTQICTQISSPPLERPWSVPTKPVNNIPHSLLENYHPVYGYYQLAHPKCQEQQEEPLSLVKTRDEASRLRRKPENLPSPSINSVPDVLHRPKDFSRVKNEVPRVPPHPAVNPLSLSEEEISQRIERAHRPSTSKPTSNIESPRNSHFNRSSINFDPSCGNSTSPSERHRRTTFSYLNQNSSDYQTSTSSSRDNFDPTNRLNACKIEVNDGSDHKSHFSQKSDDYQKNSGSSRESFDPSNGFSTCKFESGEETGHKLHLSQKGDDFRRNDDNVRDTCNASQQLKLERSEDLHDYQGKSGPFDHSQGLFARSQTVNSSQETGHSNQRSERLDSVAKLNQDGDFKKDPNLVRTADLRQNVAEGFDLSQKARPAETVTSQSLLMRSESGDLQISDQLRRQSSASVKSMPSTSCQNEDKCDLRFNVPEVVQFSSKIAQMDNAVRASGQKLEVFSGSGELNQEVEHFTKFESVQSGGVPLKADDSVQIRPELSFDPRVRKPNEVFDSDLPLRSCSSRRSPSQSPLGARPPKLSPGFSVESLLASKSGAVRNDKKDLKDSRDQKEPKEQRNYKNMTRERRIEANARERTRVHTISAAFDTLRRAIPAYSHNQKLSKLSVLRIACSYILTLSRVAGNDYSADQSEPSLASCVDLVSRTIQTEGKLRKKKDE